MEHNFPDRAAFDFSRDDYDHARRHDVGVIQDQTTWQFVRWYRDADDGTLRLAVEDCYRLLRVKRTEKPAVSRMNASIGKRYVKTCPIPKDDDDDGQTVVKSTIPFALVPRLLNPLSAPVRERAVEQLGDLVRLVAQWEEEHGHQSQRPWPKGMSQEGAKAIP